MSNRKQKKHTITSKTLKSTHSSVNNLLYGLSRLYRTSPGFVFLAIFEIPLSIGISLLGVYLPSVLVADITKGAEISMILSHLALLGGGLVFLYGFQSFTSNTQGLWAVRMRYNGSLRLAKEAMHADYEKIENADFETEIWQLNELHLWSGIYSLDFMQSFVTVATSIIGMALYTGMLSGLHFFLVLVVIAGAVLNFVVGAVCTKWDAANRRRLWNIDNKLHYLCNKVSSFDVSKDVHLYNMPGWLDRMFGIEMKNRVHGTIHQQTSYYIEGGTWAFSQMICDGFAYFYLIYCVCQGRIGATEFVLYFGILTAFANWCNSIVNSIKKLHQNALYIEQDRKFSERLLTDPELEKEELKLPTGHIPEISFVNVSFQYDKAEEPTIRHLNLTLKPGENLALVGLNGAGKTTFIKLLCGFYDPTDGEIRIDGIDRRHYRKSSYLKIFSGVFQDTRLFPIPLIENLVLDGNVNEKKLTEALQQADIEDRIKNLPEGIHTMLGRGIYEGAVEFSGGEEQRIMLARALYKQTPLLVLDEPTAALDPLTESELYERYHQFSKNKTTVFISHRLASTRFCDRILLMEHGEVTETGTHEELLKKGQKYAWMFHLQSKYYQQKEAGLEGEVLGDE